MFILKVNANQTRERMSVIRMYEGGSISIQPTKEKRKFRKSGDLFLNIVSFWLDTLDTAMLQLI